MVHNRFLWVVLGISLLTLSTAPLFAQATFLVSSSTATGADIGVTELTGQITLSVVSGMTVASPLLIQYSAPITSNYPVEIRVRGTGGLAGITPYPAILGAERMISIDVPAGGVPGDAITILGVRVSVADSASSSVTATVTSSSAFGNAILAGLNTVTVISRVMKPFSVDLSQAPPLSYSNGNVTQGASTFVITEGYQGAFTDAVGILGQTLHTQIRISSYPTELPSGVSVTFAANAYSGLGGTLTTLSGQDETIPQEDGTFAVVYEYYGTVNPITVAQSFTISVKLNLQETSTSGTINFQCELVPVGTAVPNEDFPSTAVPRWKARLVPDASDLPGPSTSVFLSFPFRAQSDGIYTALAMTNTLGTYVGVTLTPYDSNGILAAPPKTLSIPPKNQIAKLATDVDMFGPNFNVGKAGTILAEAKAPLLPGFYLLGDFNGSRLDGATAEMNSMRYWVWPMIFRQTPSPFTTLEMFNPNTKSANAKLTLYDSTGKSLQVVSFSLPPSGSVAQSIQQIFPFADFSSFTGGYVKGESDAPLVARETFGNALDSNVLPGQIPQPFGTAYWPHFASGGGLTTELTFVNDDPTLTANLTLTVFDSSGGALGLAQLSILAGDQVTTTISQLFPNIPSAQTIVGYIRVDVIPVQYGPFLFTPSIAAALRFSAANGSGSATLPLSLATYTEFVYAHAVQTVNYYTGIAILNKNAVPALLSVQVFTNAGVLVGTGALALQPGEKIAKLLHELVPAANGQAGGYVHITSNQPVMSLSIFGSYNGLSLSAIPPQNVAK